MTDFSKLIVVIYPQIIEKSGCIWPWISLKNIQLKVPKTAIYQYCSADSEAQSWSEWGVYITMLFS